MPWPWSELGLPGPAGVEEIRHAYAQRLKDVHPEEDPEGFQRLHQAYQTARKLAHTTGGRPSPAGTDQAHPAGADFVPLEEPVTETPDWDFETILAEEPEEEEIEDEVPEEASAWVPPAYHRRGPRRQRLSEGQKGAVLIAVMFIIAIILNWPSSWFPKSAKAATAAETQAWLEDTFQTELVSSPYNKDREEDRFLYWLEDNPDVRFQAICDGDGEYRTNFINAMLFWEMKAFAQEWPDYPLWFDQDMTDREGAGADGGSPPALFFFQVPLEGAEEFLAALGARLEQIAHSDWYTKQEPEYLVALAHEEVILHSYDSTRQDMPTSEELLTFYHEDLCGVLLVNLLFQQDVVAWDYPDEENLIWANTGAGYVLDVDGWWISCRGTGRDGTDLSMYYFLRSDYTALYCIPGSVMDHPTQMFTLSCIETLTMSCGREVEIYRVL